MYLGTSGSFFLNKKNSGEQEKESIFRVTNERIVYYNIEARCIHNYSKYISSQFAFRTLSFSLENDKTILAYCKLFHISQQPFYFLFSEHCR